MSLLHVLPYTYAHFRLPLFTFSLFRMRKSTRLLMYIADHKKTATKVFFVKTICPFSHAYVLMLMLFSASRSIFSARAEEFYERVHLLLQWITSFAESPGQTPSYRNSLRLLRHRVIAWLAYAVNYLQKTNLLFSYCKFLRRPEIKNVSY